MGHGIGMGSSNDYPADQYNNTPTEDAALLMNRVARIVDTDLKRVKKVLNAFKKGCSWHFDMRHGGRYEVLVADAIKAVAAERPDRVGNLAHAATALGFTQVASDILSGTKPKKISSLRPSAKLEKAKAVPSGIEGARG